MHSRNLLGKRCHRRVACNLLKAELVEPFFSTQNPLGYVMNAQVNFHAMVTFSTQNFASLVDKYCADTPSPKSVFYGYVAERVKVFVYH